MILFYGGGSEVWCGRVSQIISKLEAVNSRFGVTMVGDGYVKTNLWNNEIQKNCHPLGFENSILMDLL